MKLRDTIYAKCSCCGHTADTIQEEAYGCDTCGKDITGELMHPSQLKYSEVLGLTVFWKDRDTHNKDRHLCSWKCLLVELRGLAPRMEDIDFITLPYLSPDNHTPGQEVSDFMDLFKKPETK